jgi:proteasome assembly chaperone (PAC2) family protein
MNEQVGPQNNLQQIITILAKISALNIRMNAIDDRVKVLEHCTQSHEGRLEDLEGWKDKLDDKLEDQS